MRILLILSVSAFTASVFTVIANSSADASEFAPKSVAGYRTYADGLDFPALWLQNPKFRLGARESLSPDRQFSANVGSGVISVASTRTRKVLWQSEYSFHNSIRNCVWFSDSKRLAVGAGKGVFYLDALTGVAQKKFEDLKGSGVSLQGSPDRQFLAAIGDNYAECTADIDNCKTPVRTLLVWNLIDKVNFRLDDVGTDFRWSPDSKRIAVFRGSRAIEIWNIASHQKEVTINLPRAASYSFEWSPNQLYLAVHDMMIKEICIYGTAHGKPLVERKFDTQDNFKWSPDGFSIIESGKVRPQIVHLTFMNGRLKPEMVAPKTLGVQGYIPETLDEAMVQLDAELPSHVVRELKAMKENELINCHFGLALYLRNSWLRHGSSRLSQQLPGSFLGVDGQSSYIVKAYWSRLQGLPLSVSSRIKQRTASRAEAAAVEQLHKADVALRVQERAQQKAREQARRAEITKRMLNWHLVRPAGLKWISLPAIVKSNIHCTYMAPYKHGVLIVGSNYDGNSTSTTPYFYEVATSSLHPIKISELKRIECAVVVEGKLYVSGVTRGKRLIVECGDEGHRVIAAPVKTNFLTLGVNDKFLLAVCDHSVKQLENGVWKNRVYTAFALPPCSVAPREMFSRLYLRDEGVHQDGKRLWWLNYSSPAELDFFESDARFLWEEQDERSLSGSRVTVNSFTQDSKGNLWIASHGSLLRWNLIDGYKIALFENCLSLQKSPRKILDAPGVFNIDSKGMEITAVLSDGALLRCVGPSGFYELNGNELTQILQFTNTSQDNECAEHHIHHEKWVPTSLLRLGVDDYLIGTAWGGTARLTRNVNGDFVLTLVDTIIESPVHL